MIKSTFSILFLVRKARQGKNGEALISMRITINGRFTEMSTLRKVPANLWDSKKERAVGKGPIPIEINRHLESLHIDTRQACKRREVYISFSLFNSLWWQFKVPYLSSANLISLFI